MLTKSETLSLIKTVSRRTAKTDADIQQILIACVYYSVNSGDVTLGERAMSDISTGIRHAAMAAFLETYGQFEINGKKVKYRSRAGDTFTVEGNEHAYTFRDMLRGEDNTKHVKADELAEAYCASIKTHWTALKPEKQVSIYDLKDQVKQFIAKMEREIKAGQARNTEVYDIIASAWNTYLEESTPVEDEGEDDDDDVSLTSAESVTAEIKELLQKAA